MVAKENALKLLDKLSSSSGSHNSQSTDSNGSRRSKSEDLTTRNKKMK